MISVFNLISISKYVLERHRPLIIGGMIQVT